MALVQEYLDARRDEDLARLRRAIALRAMLATGMSQRQIAEALAISQPAVSQQLRNAPSLGDLAPDLLLRSAAPVLKALAEERGYTDLAVFGSIARGQARPDSDIDLIVRAPAVASSFDFVGFKTLLEQVLGREVDLVDYGGLQARVDDDIRREAVPL